MSVVPKRRVLVERSKEDMRLESLIGLKAVVSRLEHTKLTFIAKFNSCSDSAKCRTLAGQIASLDSDIEALTTCLLLLNPEHGVQLMAKLDTKKRKALPKDDFAEPSKRAYPIPDKSHARNALARASGKPVDAEVKRKVEEKFPSIKVGGGKGKKKG